MSIEKNKNETRSSTRTCTGTTKAVYRIPLLQVRFIPIICDKTTATMINDRFVALDVVVVVVKALDP